MSKYSACTRSWVRGTRRTKPATWPFWMSGGPTTGCGARASSRSSVGVGGNLLQLVRSQLRSVSRRIVVGGRLTEQFAVLLGLPQGAVLSPLLCCTLFIDGLIAELKKAGLGIVVLGERLPALLYADGILLLASNADELQAMLEVAARYASCWRFRFAANKSGVML